MCCAVGSDFHLKALRYVRQSVTRDVANTMACAIIDSRLDYCNSLFYGMSQKNFDRLQRVQNRAARIVYGVGQRQQNARQLRPSLHWLPVRAKTDFKLHWPSSHGRRANLIISLWSFNHMNHSAVYVRRHTNC